MQAQALSSANSISNGRVTRSRRFAFSKKGKRGKKGDSFDSTGQRNAPSNTLDGSLPRSGAPEAPLKGRGEARLASRNVRATHRDALARNRRSVDQHRSAESGRAMTTMGLALLLFGGAAIVLIAWNFRRKKDDRTSSALRRSIAKRPLLWLLGGAFTLVLVFFMSTILAFLVQGAMLG
jgi:hypothetical protein